MPIIQPIILIIGWFVLLEVGPGPIEEPRRWMPVLAATTAASATAFVAGTGRSGRKRNSNTEIYIEIVLDIEIQDPMACQDLSSLIYLIFTYHFCSLLECHQSYPSMASSPLQLLARGNNERHGQIQRPLSAYEGSHSYSAGGSRSTQLGSWYQSHSHTNRLKTHSWTQRTLG